MTAKHFLAAFLGALAMFLAAFIFHMFTPLGEAGITPMPGPEAVMSAMSSSIRDKPGMYMFPTGGYSPDLPREQHAAAIDKMMEEMKTNPSGLLIYHPAGRTFNFGKCLAIQFGIDFLKALLVVYLLAQTSVTGFGGRTMFVTIAGALAAIATTPSLWNWYGFAGTYACANVVMITVEFLVAGIVIALVLRRKNLEG
ncbi:MAG TPA: hypothetical protein VGW39_08015 [Chthoniobacterales bacterium]|nr:hypothetical protein [Chthoniobacterales bacterium]